jgi:hypothetical protein
MKRIAQDTINTPVQGFGHWCEMVIAVDGGRTSGLLSPHWTCPKAGIGQSQLVSTAFTAEDDALINRKCPGWTAMDTDSRNAWHEDAQ